MRFGYTRGMAYTPTVFTKPGYPDQIAYTAAEAVGFRWDGWLPIGEAPAPSPGLTPRVEALEVSQETQDALLDGFSDSLLSLQSEIEGIPAAITPGITTDVSEAVTTSVTATVTASFDRGEVLVAAPTGVAATDSAAIADAITAASSTGKVIVLRKGTYFINTYHAIPDGVDLRGQGGGSTSRAGRTIIKCTTAGSGISISGGGGMSGHFQIDGNSTANTPFKRLGGLGANARLFENLIVKSNTGDADLAWFHGAQNDLFVQCGFADSSRDLAWFDQGFGGASFVRCQWRTAGRYHHRYDVAVGGGVYASATDIHHIGGICEGNSGTSLLLVTNANNVTYSDHAFYSANGATGPMIDVVAGSGIAFHNPWLQSTGAIISGTEGFRVRGTASITVTGRAIMQNLDKAAVVEGAGSFIYTKCNWLFYSVTTNFTGVSGGTVAQIADLQLGGKFTVGSENDFAEISQPSARDRFRFSRTIGGVLSYYNNAAAAFTPDIQLLRRAAGAWGVVNGTQQVLVTGAGTTAQRPAAATALLGALYVNTELGCLQVCVSSSAWADYLTHTWTAATILAGVTTNPSGSGAPIGYTKIGGTVHLRGLAASVSIGATVLFQLPAGYRPAYQTNIPILTITGGGVVTAGYVSIATNGNVSIPAGAGGTVSFDGVCFPAEA